MNFALCPRGRIRVDCQYPCTAEITLTGGHIAPVTFVLGDARGSALLPATVATARLPRHGADPVPPARGLFLHAFRRDGCWTIHGEVANNRWHVDRHGPSSVTLSMRASDLDADIHKTVSVNDNDAVLYQQVRSHGLLGRCGTTAPTSARLFHAPPGSGRLSTSPMPVLLGPSDAVLASRTR